MTSYKLSYLATEVQVTKVEVERVRRALEKELATKAMERLMVVIMFWLPESVCDKLDMNGKALIVAKLLKLLRGGSLKQYSGDDRKCYCEGVKYLRSKDGRAWMAERFLPKEQPRISRSQSKRSKATRPATPTPAKLAIAPSAAEKKQDATLQSPTSPNLPWAASSTPVFDSSTVPCALGVEVGQGRQRLIVEESGLCVQCWTVHPKNRGGPFISLATPATLVGKANERPNGIGGGWRRRITTGAFAVSSAAIAVYSIAWFLLQDVSSQPRKEL